MNEPEQFAHKIEAYPTVHEGGVIFAYMGAANETPQLPEYEYTLVPDAQRTVSKVCRSAAGCRRWRAASTPHTRRSCIARSRTNTRAAGISPASPFVRGNAPTLDVDLTDYGYQYAGIRPLDEASVHIRTYHFVMPFHQIRPYQTSTALPGGGRPHLGADG